MHTNRTQEKRLILAGSGIFKNAEHLKVVGVLHDVRESVVQLIYRTVSFAVRVLSSLKTTGGKALGFPGRQRPFSCMSLLEPLQAPFTGLE